MDHHGDWGQWHEDGSGFDGDTADLGGDHLGDLGGHDDGYPGHEGHEGYDGYDEQPDLSGHDLPGHDAPDLVHEGFDHDDQLEHHGYTEPDEPPAPADHLVGTDPDAPPGPDGAWHDGDFPPPLDLDARPEPSDGYPWADADT